MPSTQMTGEEAAMAILQEINSPLVGKEVGTHNVAHLLQYCMKETVYDYLSSGEQILVQIALSIHTGTWKLGPGFPALGMLDRNLRRRLWLIIGSVYGMEPHA
jgi:hypothetical protein